MNISINNKQWTRVQLSAGFSCLTPQTQGSFYYSRTDLGTDVSDLEKRLDVVSFSRPLGITLTAPTDIWVLSTEDEGLLSYETEIVSGAKVIFVNTGGGGGSPTGSYIFNNPLSETGGIVNLNFDTNGLKLQNGRLTLDLSTDPTFTNIENRVNTNANTIQTLSNDVLDLQQDINALEAQDTVFEGDINTLKGKVGTTTLITTAKDLSGAVNELANSITTNTLNFSSPLIKIGNDISLSLDNDLQLNQTGDSLTLNLLANNDFRNVLLNVDEAKKIADYTQVGRVMPMQNHFVINALNGELSLDLSPTSILTATFAPKSIEAKVNQAVTDIARLDNEVADLDNQVNLLETGKVDTSDFQTLEGRVATNEGNISTLQNTIKTKADATDLNQLSQKVTFNENNITQLQTELGNKANSSDVYTKNQTYTKQEVNSLVSNKADASTVTALETKVNQNESDVTQLKLDVANKADSSSVYTKSETYTKQEVNGLLSNKADSSSLNSIDARVTTNEGEITTIKGELSTKADVGNVYLKNETYSKLETDGFLNLKADSSALQALEVKVTNNEGNISQNSNKIQTLETNYTTLDSKAVKIDDIPQDIDGLKKFLKELEANNIKAKENGADYGAVDIRNQDGYFSISEDGGVGASNLLAALGFVDTTTTFRIRNLAGGLVTFNTLAQYETTLTPTDDKDLVPLATLNQVKAELLSLIQGSQGGLTFIGEISNTKAEVELNPTLLDNFVQTIESRTSRKGDFVRTSDSFGFIYNGTDWRNFGQVSVSVATTTSAGIVMLGTNEGELEDIGGGKVKVIGWDTVKQALIDLDSRTTTNTQNITNNTQNITQNTSDIRDLEQSLSTLDGDVVKIAGSQTITGEKTFSNQIVLNNKLQINANASDYNLRFIGDGWTNDQATSLFNFWKGSEVAGYKVSLTGTNFDYAELFGLTLISNMKDPTNDNHGANVRWVKGWAVPKVSTTAINTIQVTNNSQKYFNLDYIYTNGTTYRNWSGIQIRNKQEGDPSFTTMWKLEYRDTDAKGIFMSCVGNKLSFENDTKIIGVSCEDSDPNNSVVSKLFLTSKTGDLTLLTTNAKDNLVNAINEVKGIADNATTSLSLKADSSTIGNLQDLTTTSKTNLVSAVNEVNGKFSNLVDLTSQQIITGEKDFDNEVRANTLVTHDNGLDYGSLDIRNNAGYLSISDDTQGAVSKSATFGFEDGNDNLVIRNNLGNVILANKVLRYESVITPTDDKDLVPFLEVKNVSNKIGDLTNLTTQDKTSLVLAVNELVTNIGTKADDNNVVKLSGNQSISGEKTFNDVTRHNAIINLRNNNACINFEGISSYSQGYAIRFQADSLTAGSTVDMLRFHKAGNKWNIKAYLNSSNAFDRVEINGPTRVTNMLDPTANTHGANKQYVDTKSSLADDNTFSGSNTFSRTVNAVNLQATSNIGTATGSATNLGAIDINGANRFLSFSDTLTSGLTRTAMIGRDTSTGGKLRIYNSYPKATGGNESIIVNTAIEMPSGYTPTENKFVADKEYVDTSITTNVGTLTNLTTTAQDNIVNSINEVNDKFSLYKKTVVIPAGGSLPQQTEADTFYLIEV